MRSLARKALRGNAPLYSTAKRLSLAASYLARRPHEPEFRWLAGLSGTGVFLDVGANSGQSALSYRMFNRQVPILSLEPNPACEPDLRLVRRCIRRFDYAMVAAGDRPGRTTLTIPVVRRVAASQAASLDPGVVARRRGEIEGRAGGDVTLSEVTVPVVAVDSLGLDVLAMKIDVEGTERAVLAGASETIDRHRPVVMLETGDPSGEALRFLEGHGYGLYVFDPVRARLVDRATAGPSLNVIALPQG
jgi:FkbM family methyltransferase